jgi:glycosyltransferase involved in cell wall biosynthesis
MIYAALPFGSNFGWGVLGKQVVLALAQLTDVCLRYPPNVKQQLDDEFDVFQLRSLIASPQENRRPHADGPIIQAAIGKDLHAFVPHLAPPAHVGFAVFEDNVFSQSVIAAARRQYRHLACGSNYCADVLHQHGLTDISVVLHGVDTTLFFPRQEKRSFAPDRFVIFSGGKFELRKGQDIVIRAYKVLQDRHADVMLVNSWHNSWARSRDTMQGSKLIHYDPPANRDYFAWMNKLLAANGIDMERVITVGKREHGLLPILYHATDLGVFPNRVEGGTNLVLMEYMACGKPVIASYNSGHKDVLRRENAVLIENHGVIHFRKGMSLTNTWHNPNLEETIEKLEWCYQHRDQLKLLGKQAAEDMREFSWKRVAEGLLRAVRRVQAE